jgi:hypothetical protein
MYYCRSPIEEMFTGDACHHSQPVEIQEVSEQRTPERRLEQK